MSVDVLLVESDGSAAGVIAHGLARQGLRVVSLAADEALEAVRTELPALVVANVEDGAPGRSLLERLREDPRFAAVPIVALGKRRDPGEAAVALGATQFLQKPLYVQDVAVLGRLHAGHHAAQETFVGDLGQLRCQALVRGLLAGGRTGQLRFDPAGGRLYFRDGRIVDAVLPPLAADRALLRLLTLSAGRYRLELGEFDRPTTLSIDLTELTGRCSAHVRRWDEIAPALGSLEAVYELDRERLAGSSEEVPAALHPLLDRFDGRCTVAEILGASEAGDLAAAGAVAYARSLGLLREPLSPAEQPLTPVAEPAEGMPPTAEPVEQTTIDEIVSAEERASGDLAAVASAVAGETAAESDSMAVPLPTEDVPVGDLEESFFASELSEAGGALEEPTADVPRPALSNAGAFWLGFGGVALVGALVLAAWPNAPKPVVAPPSVAVAPKPAPALQPLPALPPAPTPAEKAADLVVSGQKAYDAGKLAEALAAFEQAVALAPTDPNALLSLGMARYDHGQLQDAVGPLEQARALAHNPRASLLLGAVYQELGDATRARARYEEYLKLDANGSHDGEVRAILRTLASR